MYTMLGAVAALREESGMFLRPNEGSADLAATLVAAERLAIKVDGERLGAVNAAAGDARTPSPRRPEGWCCASQLRILRIGAVLNPFGSLERPTNSPLWKSVGVE